MITLAAVAIVLPVLAAFAGPLLRRAGRGPWTGSAVLTVAAQAVSTLLTIIVALAVWTHPGVRTGTLTVVPTGTVPIGIGLYVDGLAAVVAVMVCCVALAVQVYSVSAMAADRRHGSYTAFISLSTAAMLLVVLSGDLIVLDVGWAVMGLCSYVLIGLDANDRARSRAAVRAFLMARVGDVGFLLGIIVLGLGAGTFSIRGVSAYHYPHATVLAGTLLLLAGVVGRGAQVLPPGRPPDMLSWPAPAGAPIQAATMVAAGGYVVARLFPVFVQAPAALAALGVIAAISMLGSALTALVQSDLRLVLAYSTIGQLAYVAAGLAAGARDAAVFHLLALGVATAVLFLGAEWVITVVASKSLTHMGGLRLAMPVMFWSMTIGWATIVGVPVASGFFSKNAILTVAQHAAFGNGERGRAFGVVPPSGGIPAWTAVLVYVAMLITVAVTAAYATRAWLMTFFGERRMRFRAGEAPPLLRWPVAALAAPALVLGFFGLGSAELRPGIVAAIVALAMVGAGGGAAFVVWNRDPALDPARRLGPVRTVLDRASFVDDLYDRAAVRPVRALARLVVAADDRVVRAAAGGLGRGVRGLGGMLRGTAGGDGNPQAYLTGLLAGVAVIAFVVVVFT